jgi:hypothetical protein
MRGTECPSIRPLRGLIPRTATRQATAIACFDTPAVPATQHERVVGVHSNNPREARQEGRQETVARRVFRVHTPIRSC